MPRLILKTLPANVREIIPLCKKSVADVFAKELRKRGWKSHRPSNCSGTYFFSSPCGQYFLKQNYTSSAARENPPRRYAIPTARLTNHDWYNWTLQPKADVSSRAQNKAYEVLCEKDGLKHTDFKADNLGMYKGRAVMIDW